MNNALRQLLTSAAIIAAFIGWPLAVEAQSIIDKVKQRGFVNCGASQGVPGLSRPDERGAWTGFDVETCRARSQLPFSVTRRRRVSFL